MNSLLYDAADPEKEFSVEDQQGTDYSNYLESTEEKLRELSKTVEFKKSYLQEVQNEIFKYRTDLRSIVATPARSRKNTESNKSDSRVLGDYSVLLKGRDLEG